MFEKLKQLFTRNSEPRMFVGAADMRHSGEFRDSGHKPAYNTEDNHSRIDLIAIARQLETDFAPVGYANEEIAKSIVPSGWRANTGNPETNVILNRFIDHALEAEQFDYAEDSDGVSCWRQLVRDQCTDGDSFQRYVRPHNEQSFRCQPIRADLIGSLNGTDEVLTISGSKRNLNSVGGRRYRNVGGALIDSRGRRRFWQKFKPAEEGTGALTIGHSGYVFERNLNARSISQYRALNHSDDFRGLSPLHDSAKEYRNFKIIWEYTQRNLEHASSIAAVVENSDGAPDPRKRAPSRRAKAVGPGATSGGCTKCGKTNCACPPSVHKVDQISYHYIRKGEKMMQFKAEHPNASFNDCVEHLLRMGAWSVRMPYGILFDSSKLSGAPMRFELSKASCSIKDMRGNVVKRLCQPWLRAKILEGILTGVLPFKASDLTQLAKGTWTYTRLPVTDEKYSTAAALQVLDRGLESYPAACDSLGTTFDDVLTENSDAALKIYNRAHELWTASGKEMELSWWIDQLSMRGPNGSVQHLHKEMPALSTTIPDPDDDDQ